MLADKFITMSNDEYHGHHALGSSDVRKIMVSPLHYAGHEEPAVRPPHFTFGSAVHSAYLEPDLFADEYRAKPPEVDGQGPRTKAYREWIESQPEVEWMKQDDYDKVLRVVDSALAHPISNEFFKGEVVVEGSLFFKMNGVECKARPDAVSLTADGLDVLDLKTTTDASEDAFRKSVGNLGYWIQEWFYRKALREAGYKVRRFIFLCVEKSPPFACQSFTLDQADVDSAEELVSNALRSYKRARDEDTWDGYPTQTKEISVPHWAMPVKSSVPNGNWISIKKACESFGVSRTTLYNWMSKGVESKRFGGKRYVSARGIASMSS